MVEHLLITWRMYDLRDELVHKTPNSLIGCSCSVVNAYHRHQLMLEMRTVLNSQSQG